MPSERIQRRISQFLDEADAAAARLEWERVRALADGALRLDPSNEEARELLASANRDTGVYSGAAAATDVASGRPPAMPESFVGGRYAVKEFLGEGARKRVYLAHDSVLDRDVAFALIKIEGLDDESKARVVREARVMGRLGDHPNIMPIHDLGTFDDQPYMVMPVMPGGDVEALLAGGNGNRLPLGEAIRIAAAVLSGLEFAHSQGVIHRDLKPGNIWLARDGTPRIGDFGLALLDGVRLTQSGQMIGTVAYLPPEQVLGGEITPRSDLYSLGCMLYEMVAGRPPFIGDDRMAIIGQHINTEPVAPSWHNQECPRPLETLIRRLLAKNPDERPDSAAAVRAALESMAAEVAAIAPGEAEAGREPRNLDTLASGVFAGRQREMSTLRGALEESLAGRGRIVMLAGAPGMGKTRACSELAAYAGLRGCQVLWGRCYEGAGAPPYWPWVQAIRSYVRGRDPEKLRSEMGSGAAVIAEIVSELRERVQPLPQPPRLESPESARFQLFDSIGSFLQGASASQPIVIVLDDLQWADREALLLLEFLSHEIEDSRLLILGNYQDAGLTRRHPLIEALGELNRHPLFQRITLDGLTEEEVARLIELTTGEQAPEGLPEAIHSQTEGNPLFVTEALRLLVQDEALTRDPTQVGREWDLQVPQGVREVIARRLNRLSQECVDTLSIAAVLGSEFDLAQIRGLAGGLLNGKLVEAIEAALGSRLIQEAPGVAGRYQFAHPMIADTLLGELTATRKVQMHAQIAESLEHRAGTAGGISPAELARHFQAAMPLLGPDKAVTYSVMAGEQALARLAYREALGHFRAALAARLGIPADEGQALRSDALGAVTDRAAADLLNGMACAEAAIAGRGNLGPIVESLHKAFLYYAGSGDTEAALSAVVRFPFPKVHGVPGAIELLGEALELAEPDSPDAGRLLIRLGLYQSFDQGQYDEPVEAFSRALEIARQAQDPHLEVNTIAYWAVVEWTHLQLEEAVRKALHAIELAAQTKDVQAQFESHEIATVVLAVLGKSQAAAAHAGEILELAERLHSRLDLTLALAANAELAVFRGEWDRARELAERELGGDGLDNRVLTPLLWAELQTGELERYESLLEQHGGGALAQASQIIAMAGRALIDPPSGGEIDSLARSIEAMLERPGYEPGGRLTACVALAFIAVARGDDERARRLHAELGKSGRRAATHVGVSFDRLRGLLASTFGDAELARTHFEDALQFSREAGYLPDLAWTCHDSAALLIETGAGDGPDRAPALIREGAAIAAGLGMRPLVSRLAGLWAAVSEGAGAKADDESNDELTGLPTRYQIGSLLALDLELMQRDPPDLALISIDLDHFQAVNDTYGTSVGDDLLRMIGQTLRAEAGQSGMVARVGGDEFLVVLRQTNAEAAFARGAAMARAVLRAFVQIGTERARTPCTAGVVMAPQAAAGPGELIVLAERALQSAKEAGATSAHFYDPDETDQAATSALRTARLGIMGALEEDGFRLVRMPIVKVQDRSVDQYEVLVRMVDRNGRLASPAAFIPQAEALDLIQFIDRRVVEMTMERWKAYADRGDPLHLSINISGRSMGGELLTHIVTEADRRSVPHDCVTIEITETAVARSERIASQMISDLRAEGFKVAIDDFGSGATSLRQVRETPLDSVKLDGSLIRDLATSESDRQLVTAIAGAAREIGLEVVAEYVSDEETMKFLADRQIDYAQGYYLGEPADFPSPSERVNADG